MKKEKPLYVLQRHSKEFPIENFAFIRYMSVDGGVVEIIAVYESKEDV